MRRSNKVSMTEIGEMISIDQAQRTKLSENFSLFELLQSRTASRRGFSEQFAPSKAVLASLQELVSYVLQPLRDYIGIAINVNSGYRCSRTNTAIGGSATSQHMKGEAADIELFPIHNLGNSALWKAIIDSKIEFDQLIWEFGDERNPDWIHISFSKGKNRKEILRAISRGGKTVYLKF